MLDSDSDSSSDDENSTASAPETTTFCIIDILVCCTKIKVSGREGKNKKVASKKTDYNTCNQIVYVVRKKY